MSLNGLRLRTTITNQVRQYLVDHQFEELEPQLFATADTLEPTIYPFTTGEYYLPTSPEAFLKQAMAAGMGDCFAISHAFRNLEGQGRLHNPEFMMVEWYQRNTDVKHMMSFTQGLVASILSLSTKPWFRVSWCQLWQQTLTTPLEDLFDDAAMITFAQQLQLNTAQATWEQLFYQIADIYLVSKFPHTPFFLTDYPAKISPLAQPKSSNPNFADRFELFIDGVELANGNTERFDAASIQLVMEAEQQRRPHASQLHQPFLTALKQLKGQQWTGVGLGLDRLSMLAGKIDDVHELQTF